MIYYNEIDPFAAEWLRHLITAEHLPKGFVDTRSIADVGADDLKEFTQCHFFAGIGGWSHALRLAGWPEDAPIWTGSCPCQPFSVAGKQKGTADARHLWPEFFRLIAGRRPPVVMGEQVAGKAGYGWFDGVRSDLEREGYTSRGVDIPACAVNAPHIRQRLYWVATNLGDTNDARLSGHREFVHQHGSEERHNQERRAAEAGVLSGERDQSGDVAHPESIGRREGRPEYELRGGRPTITGAGGSHWSNAEWRYGADGKARRVKPRVRLLADGVLNRVGKLRGYGNAIVPPLAAEVIKAFMDTLEGQSRGKDQER